MSELRQTLDHKGVTYQAQTAWVESTHIGREDHGLFAVDVRFAGDGWGQGMGGWAVDDVPLERGGPRRFTSGFGLALIEALIRVIGSGVWENLPHQPCLALREESYGAIRGVASLDGTRVVIFRDLWFEFYEEDRP